MAVTNINNLLTSSYSKSQLSQIQMFQSLYSNKNSSSTTSALSSLTSSYKKTAVSADQQSFLKTYQSKLTGLMTSANSVKLGKTDKLAATTSDAKVATASGRLTTGTTSFSLKVDQIAQSQTNKSTALSSTGSLPAYSGALKISTSKGSFDLSLSSAGTGTNKAMLEKFATSINDAKTGVKAEVVEKDGMSTLSLTGEDGKAFTVSGTLADRLGLDQVSQAAQQASYTVVTNGVSKSYTSSTNEVTINGVDVSLKAAGSTTIKTGTDATSAKADNLEQLVNTFNSTLGYLNDNSDKGVGVLQQIKRMVITPTSERSMATIGLTVNKDGTMNFDRDKFAEASARSPSLVNGIVDTVVRGIGQDAERGLRTAAVNLLSSDFLSQQSTSSSMDPLSYLSSYNRNGIQSYMNYNSIGALLNTLI